MRQWWTLFRKEMLQRWRNFQWIWVPIAFFVLGAMDPVMNHFLPEILKMSGDATSDLLNVMPKPTMEMALAGSISEFMSIGVLIIALMNMGTIASERKSGVIEMVLVKPVNYWHYISSKFAAGFAVAGVGLLVGFASTAFYTTVLFEAPDWHRLLIAYVLFLVWYALLVGVTVFFNTLVPSAGAIGAIVFAFAFIVDWISGTFKHVLEINPGLLTNYAGQAVQNGDMPAAMWVSAGLAVLLIAILLYAARTVFAKREPLLK